jgi:endonuclease III
LTAASSFDRSSLNRACSKLARKQEGLFFSLVNSRKKEKLQAVETTLIEEKKATLEPSTVKLLSQQTKKAQSERSNGAIEGEKKSQRDWSRVKTWLILHPQITCEQEKSQNTKCSSKIAL